MKRKTFRKFGMFTESISLQPGQEVDISCNGPLTLSPAASDQLEVSGVGRGKTQQQDGRIVVRGHGPVSVKAPQGANLALQVRGPVQVEDLRGTRIHADQILGPVIIKTLDSLSFDTITGPMNAFLILGAIEGKKLVGALTLNKVAGDINIDEVIGPVTIKDFAGSANISVQDGVYIVLTGEHAQSLHVRSQGDVFLKMPAAARVQGKVKSLDGIRVEIDQKPQSESPTEVVFPPAEGNGPVITLDIKAEGEVYIGPNPPAMPTTEPHYTKTVGKGWLARIFSGLGRETDRRPSASATSPPRQKDNLTAEREMVLRMVAEGKITAEEGDQLLEALQ